MKKKSTVFSLETYSCMENDTLLNYRANPFL